MAAKGFGAWRVEACDECDGSCNADQGRGQCAKQDAREGYFVVDYAADLFVRAVMVAAIGVLSLIFVGVWL